MDIEKGNQNTPNLQGNTLKTDEQADEIGLSIKIDKFGKLVWELPKDLRYTAYFLQLITVICQDILRQSLIASSHIVKPKDNIMSSLKKNYNKIFK